MARAVTRPNSQIEALEHQLEQLRTRQQRDRRALEVLYNISMVCRDRVSFRLIFEATYRELRAVFPLDSCYIALCDSQRPDLFRAVLMVDEGLSEYVEQFASGPLMSMLMRERTPLLFRDLVEEGDRLPTPPHMFGDEHRLSRAWMGVPLLMAGDTIGVIAIQSYQAGVYDEVDLDLLQRVGNVVAVALENARLAGHQRELSQALAERVAARTHELQALSELADEMVLQRPLPALLDRALSLIVPLFEIDGGTVRLLTSRQDELALIAQYGIPDAYLRAAERIKVEGGTLGRVVVLENRPLVLNSGLADQPRTGAAPPFESLLAVPLRIGGRVVGVLSLFGRQARTFGEQQIDLAQVIGNQIAIAVENSRLFEERARQIAELQALSDISRATSTALDLPTLLRHVHQSLLGFMRLDAFVMIVYDPERQVIAEGIGIDDGQEYTYLSNQPPPPDSLTGWVIRNRRMLHFRNLVKEITAYPELRQIVIGTDQPAASWLGVPLFDRAEQLIGMICIQSYTAYAFSERDENFLNEVARHVTLHVQNVRLLIQRERQIRELDAIGRIGQLASASYDLDVLLDGVYDTLAEATSLSVFYLVICEPDTHNVTNAMFVEQGESLPLDWYGRPPTSGSMTAWILRHREPLIFQDLAIQRSQLLARGIQPRPLGPENPVRSWVGVPLLARDGETIGVLSVQDYQAYRYDTQTIDFLGQVASHISLAVQKVRLFEERQRQLEENARLFAEARAHAEAAQRQAHRMELVHRISLVLSSRLDQQEILDLAAREVVRLFWADHTGIVLFDEQQGLGTVAAEYPPSSALGTHLPLVNNPIIEELITSGRPVCITSVATDPRAETIRADLTQLDLVSLIVVPLVSRGRVIGSIGLDSIGKPRVFTEEEQELLLTVAASIAAAVENARLFAAEQDARRTADTLREVARVLSSSFDPGVVLQLILGELQRVIPYDTGSIMLIEGKSLRIAALRDREEIAIPRLASLPIEGRGGARLVVQRREPVLIPDTLESPDWTPIAEDSYIRSWLGVPLIAKGSLVGVLNINASQPSRFTERDVEVALAFANQAAVAMENAQLYQESVTRVEQELTIAREIQSNLFPRALPQEEGLELAAMCLPARETGGDFYDVMRLGGRARSDTPTGRLLGIMVGDVSGKSIPAAMLMAVARSVARSEARDHKTPEVVIRETNRWMVLDVPPRSFVAFSYATLDLRRRRLALANAGQLAPLRRRADGHVEYLEVRGPTLPLGIVSNVPYVALEVDLEPGDVLVFYTDGIVEAQDRDHTLFGFERLEELVHVHGNLPPQRLIDRVLAAIEAFTGQVAPHDDMTMVVLRIA